MSADKISKKKRSYIMSMIRSKNTKAELILKKSLKGTGLRYQPNITGKPDFGLKNRKVAVFVDGCFWHKCSKCFRPPKSNKSYWTSKIQGNVLRDKRIRKRLRFDGYNVVRIWEHEIYSDIDKCTLKVRKIL